MPKLLQEVFKFDWYFSDYDVSCFYSLLPGNEQSDRKNRGVQLCIALVLKKLFSATEAICIAQEPKRGESKNPIIKQNIEEIIHFSSIFEEKKESMNSMKKPKGNYLEEISFVEEAQKEESKKNKKEKSVYDLEYKDSDGNEGKDKADN